MAAGVNAESAETAPPPRWRQWRERLARRALRFGLPLLAAVGVAVAGFALVASAGPDRADVDLGPPSVFYALPEMVTTLDGGGPRHRYVRLALVLEVPKTALGVVRAGEPAILDGVQQHLRTLSPADLVGEAGTLSLRGTVRAIIAKRLRPTEVRGVLFTQFLVD